MKTSADSKMRGATSKNLPRLNSLLFSHTKAIRVSLGLRVIMNLAAGSATTCPMTMRDVWNACHHRRSCRENQTTQPIIVIRLCSCHSRAPPTISPPSSQSIFFVISHDLEWNKSLVAPLRQVLNLKEKTTASPPSTLTSNFELQYRNANNSTSNSNLLRVRTSRPTFWFASIREEKYFSGIWQQQRAKRKKKLSRQGMSNLIT